LGAKQGNGFDKAKVVGHELMKLMKDEQDLMETVVTQWTKIAIKVQYFNLVGYYRGYTSCKDKWTTMYTKS
jgi:hypothetical protein